jgi:hypothetical protein
LLNLSGDNPDQAQVNAEPGSKHALLLSWVVSRAERARQHRDQLHGERWKEYTRLWRGFWKASDAQFKSERSRLISPALAQSIEMTVSEIGEAMFGREAWLDIADDINDKDKDDAIVIRDNLLEDIETCNARQALDNTFLLGAIYGTGISKLHVEVAELNEMTSSGVVFVDEKILIPIEAVRPDEFFIDPAATTIAEAQYCGHDVVKPMHTVKDKMIGDDPIYKNVSLQPYAGQRGDTSGTGVSSSVDSRDDAVLITEFYGKVPSRYLTLPEDHEYGPTVEAIVTVANNSHVLRAIPTPFAMKDRPFAAYQHDTVPGEFWGRGVAEKGYNPQKALDTELRARADSLALITAPMMGADMTRIGKNPDLSVRPGKFLLTRGRPSEIIEPIGFSPQGLALTFQQSGDLERQVQMGTGAMDSATPIGTNRRNETASGMSMLQASFLKRAKRTMQNIERQYMQPLIKGMLWRYMQFDPQRYPKDYKFKVRAAMGIMAREVENSQLVSMLGYTPPESPAHGIILKALFDNTASADKRELKAAIEAMLAPPSEEQKAMQQQMQALQLRMQTAEVVLKEAEGVKAQMEALLAKARATHETVKAEFVDDEIEIKAAGVAIAAEQTRVAREGNEIKKVQANKPKPKAKK